MGRSIVIVDDDPDAREILNLILGTLEIPIRQASDGAEALKLILDDLPLLIVLDLAMPNVDGRAVLRELRADASTKNIPVIIFTAEDIAPEKAEELGVPLSMMIRKGSVSMTRLRELVTQLLVDVINIDLSLM